MMKLAAFLVVTYGLFTIYKGYNFVANPEVMQKSIDEMIKTRKKGKFG